MSNKADRKNAQMQGNSRIRVLMCCSDLQTAKGGMVTVVQNYLSYPAWKHSQYLYVPTHKDGGKIYKSLYFVRAYLKIWILILRKQIDAAHLHMAERGSFFRKAYLVHLLKRCGIPVIIHHHAAEFEEFYSGLSDRKKAFVRTTLERADCNLVLSEFIRQQMIVKAPDARFEVLHNAVSVSKERSYHPQTTRLVMLGRQGKRKGSYDLLEALAGIKDRLPADTQLWMCGDGESDQVRERAQALGLGDILTYAGWISGEERERCLDGAMLHILPSYNEGLPMSILETMARGIPNISTCIASIPEVIKNDVTGYMIEPGDQKALQEAILKLVYDHKLREDMSCAAYKLISDGFSLENSARQLEDIYMQFAARRR